MKKTLLATSIIAIAATAVVVNAATDKIAAPAPASVTWMPVAELVTKLETQGYQVLEIEREDGRYYEVDMRDANGFKVEAYLDPATGEPLAYKPDDDDHRSGMKREYGERDDD